MQYRNSAMILCKEIMCKECHYRGGVSSGTALKSPVMKEKSLSAVQISKDQRVQEGRFKCE